MFQIIMRVPNDQDKWEYVVCQTLADYKEASEKVREFRSLGYQVFLEIGG